MATGLIGEKAGTPRRGPRQPRRGQPGQPQPRAAQPRAAQPRAAQPRAAQPRAAQPRAAQSRSGQARPTSLARPRPRAEPPRPRSEPQPTPPASGAPARTRVRSRTPFVLLLIGLLAGGLVCLLLINTTLAQNSFQITAMQQRNASLAQQAQALQQQTTQEQSPASIAAQAEKLGMRPVGRLRFIDLKNGRIYSQPDTVPGVIIRVPGYTP